MSAPYHYGCHYSNSGTVLHFLVRLPPFTKMFLQYQGKFLFLWHFYQISIIFLVVSLRNRTADGRGR